MKVLQSLLLGALVVSYVACYRPEQYRGDGRLMDAGMLAYYPRFIIEFPVIELGKPSNYSFTFAGAPLDPMTFHLGILSNHSENAISESEWAPLWASLEKSAASLEVQLVDSRGEVKCFASAQLAGGWVPAGVGVAGTPDEVRDFWHHDCSDIHLDSASTYRLHLTIESAEQSAGLKVVPRLEGGGRDGS